MLEKIVYDFTGLGPQDQIDFPYFDRFQKPNQKQKSQSKNRMNGKVEQEVGATGRFK